MISDHIYAFLARQRLESPCLVLDREVVCERYRAYARALPNTKIFYAVKANLHPAILELLVELGSTFDAAAIPEIKAVIAAGGTPQNLSYAHPSTQECNIAQAFALGVRRFAVDAVEEVDKIARAAPGAEVFCRILCDGNGADWPLSRKCGCDVNMAIEVLEHAHCSGLHVIGVSFNVGSQQLNPVALELPLHGTSP